MEQTTTGTGNTAPARPTFLKVLCILSFIGTGIGLISGLWGWWDKNHQLAGVINTMNSIGLDYAKQATSNLIVGLLNIIIFAGAIMMWNLQKTGFYIYTLGQIVQVIMPFVIGGAIIGIISGGFFSIFFSMAFITMYAVNFKHMH